MSNEKAVTINYKITLQFYGATRPFYQTLEGEFYGFASEASARAWLTRYVINPRKPDGRIDERIRFFREGERRRAA